jgi:hypothetical protein
MPSRRFAAILAAVVALHVCARTTVAEVRRWTDTTGKFSVDAELVETKPDSVVLKKAGGATITVPIARLSDADREYLKTLAKPAAKSSIMADVPPNLEFADAVTEPPAWNDGNTPFDMAAFLKAPPPEENAAPLYLEALYEFAPYEMVDLLFPNLPQDEKKKVYDKFRPRTKEHWRIEDAWEKDPISVDAAAVDAWLPTYDVGFEKLAAAQQRPKCMFQPGRSFHSIWPHTQAARGVARIVVWRTRRDIERGDVERPIQDLKMLLRLSRDEQVRGGIVAQLVAIALNHKGCELTRMILNAPGATSSQCDQILALLTEHESKAIDSFVEGNRAEYITCRQAIHDLQHRTGTFDPKTLKEELQITGDVTSPLTCLKFFADMGGSSEKQMAKVAPRLQGALLPGAWQGGKMLSDEDYAKEVAALNGFFATILSLAEKPEFRRNGEAQIKAAEAPIDETILASFVIPAESAILEATRRDKARQRGTRCLVALKRWQLEHADEAPPDLAAVVKAAGMPGVPLDSYSDQPLLMGTVAGKPVIYSVGLDGKDNQAQVEWNLAPGQPGDFIFRFEPASE